MHLRLDDNHIDLCRALYSIAPRSSFLISLKKSELICHLGNFRLIMAKISGPISNNFLRWHAELVPRSSSLSHLTNQNKIFLGHFFCLTLTSTFGPIVNISAKTKLTCTQIARLQVLYLQLAGCYSGRVAKSNLQMQMQIQLHFMQEQIECLCTLTKCLNLDKSLIV